jgi:phosphate transport system permease protein
MSDIANLGRLDPKEIEGDRRGVILDKTFRLVCLGTGLLALVILAAIAISTTKDAWPAFAHQGLSYVFSSRWDPNAAQFGAGAIIYGTLVVALIALVVAVPISMGIALFVTEVAPRRLRSSVATVMDVLAAVPSVVFGLWGFLSLKPILSDIYNWIADKVAGVPVLKSIFGHSSGMSLMTSGLIVALMIVPIITSLLREVFQTVPINDKNGALALGATRWEMIRGVVFPHSTGGMVGAIMLGLGRAMGETIAVALTVGAVAQISPNLFGAGETMPAIIARNLNESSGLATSALVGLGATLFLLTIVINMAARGLVTWVNRRTQGVA